MRFPGLWAARLGRVAIAGCFALTLVPAGAGAHSHRQDAADLGAALLMPSDVATLGFDDYGVDVGYNISFRQMIRLSGVTDEAEADTYEAYGMLGLTDLWLDPIDGSDGTASFYTSISIYDTAANAQDDFDYVVDSSADDDTIDVVDNELDLGEGGIVSVGEVDLGGSEPENGAMVTFLYQNFEVEVDLFDPEAEVDADVAVDAARIVADKLQELVESGELDGAPAPGLSMTTPRYEDSELVAGRSQYTMIDGEIVPYAHDAETNPAQPGVVEEYGMESQYGSNVEYVLGDELALNDPLIQSRVSSFDDETGAENYVQDRVETLEQSPNAGNVEEIEVPDGAYDGAAVAVTFDDTWGDITFKTTRLYVQDGARVYSVSLAGFENPELETVMTIMDDFLDCGQSGCTTTLEPPAELMQYFADQREIWLNESDGAAA